jgi:hypothetical protein
LAMQTVCLKCCSADAWNGVRAYKNATIIGCQE